MQISFDFLKSFIRYVDAAFLTARSVRVAIQHSRNSRYDVRPLWLLSNAVNVVPKPREFVELVA
jgi:hypothetical protein